MITLTHSPAPPLSHFVDFFWFQEGPAPAHARERVLPTTLEGAASSAPRSASNPIPGGDEAPPST